MVEGEADQKTIDVTIMIEVGPFSNSTTPTANHVEIHVSVKLNICLVSFL